MGNPICFFEIPADDLPALRKFYEALFGWAFTRFPGPMEYFKINTGQAELEGGMMARQHPHHVPTNYVMVEGMDEFLEKAEALGAKVLVPKSPVEGEGWFAMLMDPQNNPFGLWEADSSAP
ncbi:MAG: VOC family protein [Thermodesulfobacteriota bacterium]